MLPLKNGKYNMFARETNEGENAMR